MLGRRAIFLDRDGVLNHNVFYPDTQAWEAPRLADAFEPVPGLCTALARLRGAGFLLFLASNQPNTVNGKSPPGALAAMHAKLTAVLLAGGVALQDAFYCMHHPAVTGPCLCRKPSPYFLIEAARTHDVSLAASWMIGDRATDMQCGRAAGVHTAWVATGQEPDAPAAGLVDLRCAGLDDAVEQILAPES